MSGNNIVDEDDVDEFLYGPSAASESRKDDVSNYESGPATESDRKDTSQEYDEDLYQLYKGSTANEAQEMGEKQNSKDESENEPSTKEESAHDENEEENSDSDDDLEIILEPEEIEATSSSQQAQGQQTSSENGKGTSVVNLKPGQQGKSSSTPQTNNATNETSTGTKGTAGGIDLEAVGEFNGQPITEVDLDMVEDKPWRKPGADITDFFNYGFNEITWRAYCAKQKMLRENKKMMGDMDMADFMPMNMMMNPAMMEAAMPMGMGGMPNPMMGMPMGMPPPVPMPPTSGAGSPGMRGNRPGNFNPRAGGRPGMPMGRLKGSGGDNDRDGDPNSMNMEGDDGFMRMDFPGQGGMPMNMFPPDMPVGPMGMPFFPGGGSPMNFEGGDFRGGRTPMRNSGSPAPRGSMTRGSPGHSWNSRNNQPSNAPSDDGRSEHRSSSNDSRKRQMNSSSSHDSSYHKKSRNR
ncbi:uncharacterized protein BYT42DRAFT_124492 [Radiomyces spectabilis]|uniref:uncharacterized protein n=1 Tax=Radiomyces spectabilis TaxID=64574 RepID=UPI00221FD3E1|nr:uncharacterized protein BYT42DRAFT_124492 [Radiomyces spectabilis]KAI8368262.1 hypothetical protein BYT42DRAFT_124492 [Radiomyces spectabilis]